MSSVVVDRDISVQMRDGVELATDVYRPSDDGAYPTLVHRIPYDKSFAWYVGSLMVNPLETVENGYAVVVQDTRGRFESDGEWEPFRHEADDGYDTVEWAADQPWSDGNVGIYGSSYMGVTTWQTAIADPPHLEAAITYLTGGNYHEGWTYTGGAFELGFNLHWVLGLGWNTLDRRDASDSAREALTEAYTDPLATAEHLPVSDIPGFDEAAPYWRDWLAHPEYDDYWESVDVTAHADEIDVPVLNVTGWFDLFQQGQLDVYEAIEDRASDRAGDTQRLIVGPWDHETYLTSTPSEVGDWRFAPDVAGGVSFMSERTIAWFDRWLKGESTNIQTDGVQYFDLGRRTWEQSETWPPEHTPTEYYLHSDGNANTRFGDGTLMDTPHEGTPDSYTYDPADPVPTCGGRGYMPEMSPAGIQDRAAVEEREDVLVYTSPRLTSGRTIAGPVAVTLHASSSTPDTDFTGTLVDVSPEGYCASIADGILRARYRDSMTEAAFIDPGEVYEYEIDLGSVAHTFKAGHRIRVEISSSNFPRFDRNPNADVPVAAATPADFQSAHQQIFHGTTRPSRVTLPVVSD